MTEINAFGFTYRGTAEGDHGVFTDRDGDVFAGQIADDSACVGVLTLTDGTTWFVECDADGKEHGRWLGCIADTGDTWYNRWEHGSRKESALLRADGTCAYDGEDCRADFAPFVALRAMVVPIKELATTHADKAKKAVANKKAAEEAAPVPATEAGSGLVDRLERLARLFRDGVLTEPEFVAAKRALLF